VLSTDEDRETYLDAYAPGDANQHVAGAAVGPQSTEEVQAIIRIANEHKVPLWPISRGKNLGYVLARSAESAKQWESAVVRTSQPGDHPGFLRSWLLALA
jgi:FAD/FMN-containing dehydrogenase